MVMMTMKTEHAYLSAIENFSRLKEIFSLLVL